MFGRRRRRPAADMVAFGGQTGQPRLRDSSKSAGLRKYVPDAGRRCEEDATDGRVQPDENRTGEGLGESGQLLREPEDEAERDHADQQHHDQKDLERQVHDATAAALSVSFCVRPSDNSSHGISPNPSSFLIDNFTSYSWPIYARNSCSRPLGFS